LKVADKKQQDAVKRDTVASSLKFADAFSQDETPRRPRSGRRYMYEMKTIRLHRGDQRVIVSIRRRASIRLPVVVVAHGSFELAEYPRRAPTPRCCGHAEGRVARRLVDNLAASITTGELAKTRRIIAAARPLPQDRTAALHPLSVRRLSTTRRD